MTRSAFSPRSLADFRKDLQQAGSCAALAAEWTHSLEKSAAEDPALWITRISAETLQERLHELDRIGPEGKPLFGVPFAVKDNLDVAGFPTTAACPDFLQWPRESAPVVQLLLDAGAVCLGKTNLDQFATGLVGTRSPYGTPVNPRAPGYIPGGSSSGSACAVSRGVVAFALGTDTAGSGRVPAALQAICGWKPTRGLLSTRGLIPACRSLDCVSVFAAQAADLSEVASIVSAYDPQDPWSRRNPAIVSPGGSSTFLGNRLGQRLAIPLAEEMIFSDAAQAAAWQETLQTWENAGFTLERSSFAPFFEAAKLLYEGPWVAERTLAIDDLLQQSPGSVLPITRGIIEKGRAQTAMDAFAAMYRLAELRRATESIWEHADALLLPTTPGIYRAEEVAADPIALNSLLGTYTNFFNLLDLAAVALPGEPRRDELPFGITLAAPAFSDAALLHLATQQTSPIAAPAQSTTTGQEFSIAVCGAHLRGFPLEKQLRDLGAEFLHATQTSSAYRLYELDALRPGLVRVSSEGHSIEVEVWSLPPEKVGAFLAAIPSPLGLGRVELADGSWVCGFLCEAWAVGSCRDISHFGGWRNWCAARSESAASDQ